MRQVYVLFAVCLIAALLSAQEAEPEPGTPLDVFFKGKVSLAKDGRVILAYDFADKEQLEDWVTFKPFRVDGKLETFEVDANKVRLIGVGALRHRATFKEKVGLECEMWPIFDRDLGIVVAENAEGNQFVLYSLNDIYFQRFDGATEPQHMITRFGIKDSTTDTADKSAFRYVARGKKPPIRIQQPLVIRASKDGRNDAFDIGEESYKGKEPGRPISELWIGLYVVKSGLAAGTVKVSGHLSPKWLEKNGVDLRMEHPVEEEPEGLSPQDEKALKLVDRFQAGGLPFDEILPILEDKRVTLEVRQKAADALVLSGEKRMVGNTVGLLYSEDLEVRVLAIGVIKGHTKKAFGYNPKGSAEKRSRAIQKLIKYIKRNPNVFGSG